VEAGTVNRSVFLESEASVFSAQADLLRAQYDRSVVAADMGAPLDALTRRCSGL
jgi:outer membrane protein TolC